MTPDHFRECLALVHWSQNGLAKQLGLDERQIRRWASGEYEVPEQIARWLEKLARFHDRNPAPERDLRWGRG